MFRLAMWYSASDLGQVLTAISPVADQSLTSSPNTTGFVVPESTKFLQGGFAVMEPATAVQVQFQSPSLRMATYPSLEPFTLDASVPSAVNPDNWYADSPFELRPNEDLQAFVDSDEAVAQYVAAYLSDGPVKPVSGKIFSARITGAITSTAAGWVAGAMSLGQPLDTGRYRVVGMRIKGTGLVAGRLIFPNQTPRPGVPAALLAGGLDPSWARFGRGGVFGEFDTTNLPQLEVIGGTGTAQVGILDLIKL